MSFALNCLTLLFLKAIHGSQGIYSEMTEKSLTFVLSLHMFFEDLQVFTYKPPQHLRDKSFPGSFYKFLTALGIKINIYFQVFFTKKHTSFHMIQSSKSIQEQPALWSKTRKII